ncbi:MAG: hypothetical protein JO147_12635 [Actinobacteria bacterium]|nr:hypothetical protein [Actinomycetota bacterium]
MRELAGALVVVTGAESDLGAIASPLARPGGRAGSDHERRRGRGRTAAHGVRPVAIVERPLDGVVYRAGRVAGAIALWRNRRSLRALIALAERG